VGFAVVLLTPDDVGRSVKEEQLKPRARQNVLLELGYFISHLGRAKVCALKRGEVDIPSDFAGVVWEKMDDGNGWKLSLARELKAAGHDVDLNKAL
jgi:predicted nucleotide-binding protein